MLLGLVACALWGWPLLGFLATAVIPGLWHAHFALSLEAFAQAWQGQMGSALVNSLAVALASALVALPLGAWLAWLRTRTVLRWRGWIEAAIWVLLVMPGYFLASGWMFVAAPVGPLAAAPALLAGAQHLLGPIGIVLTLSLKALPFTYLALAGSLGQSAAAPAEAALVHGLTRRQRFGLAVMLLAPALAAGFAAAFAESASDFAVAATLGAGSGFTLATYAIDQAVNAVPLSFPVAAADAWMLLALIVPALLLQARVSRMHRAVQTVGPKFRPARPVVLSAGAARVHAGAAGLLAMAALGTPILTAAMLASGHTALDRLPAELAAVLPAFGYSLELGLVAGTVTVVLAWQVAATIARRGRGAQWLDFVLLGVLALPGIVLGASYVLVYNQPVTPLYGGSLLLGMAYVALALPASAKVLQGPVAQLHRSLTEAAKVHGLSRVRTWLCIEAPLMARPLFSAWLLAVLHIVFELPASELLYPAGRPPLAVALLNAANGFQLVQQARVQLLGLCLLLGFALAARMVFGRLSLDRSDHSASGGAR